jgi:8-oxo-dGTP pyrophosphatase MutT (NUDIX family)
MIEVSKLVVVKEGKYLLLKREDGSKSFPSLWDFVGGRLDPGESSKAAVVRETREETGYGVTVGEEIGKKEYHDDKYDILFYYFSPLSIIGDLILSSEHSRHGWFSLEEIKKMEITPAVSVYFE